MAALPSGGKMKNLFCILLLAVMFLLVNAQYACADEEKAERTDEEFKP